jgi:hypothetical protein
MLRTKVFREAAVVLDEEASVQRAELMGVQGQCDGRRLWGRGGGVREDGDAEGRHRQRVWDADEYYRDEPKARKP